MQPTLATPATSSVTTLDVADVSLELGVDADASVADARCVAATSPRLGARRRRVGVAPPTAATARASSTIDARARARRAGDGGGVEDGDFRSVRRRAGAGRRRRAGDGDGCHDEATSAAAAAATSRRRLERAARRRLESPMRRGAREGVEGVERVEVEDRGLPLQVNERAGRAAIHEQVASQKFEKLFQTRA